MTPGYAKIIDVSELGAGAKRYVLKPGKQELAAIARFLDLLSLEKLKATLTVTRDEKTGYTLVTGPLEAGFRQRCVASGREVPGGITLEIRRRFTEDPEESCWQNAREEDESEPLALGDDDIPDLAEQGKIDLGFLMIEELSLNLDPYPRAGDVGPVVYSTDPEFDPSAKGAEKAADSPFAVLKALKKERNS